MTRRLSIAVNMVLVGFLAWYFLIHKDMRAYCERRFNPQEEFLQDTYYRASVASYAALNPLVKDAVPVFAGDSLVEQFPVGELLPGSKALNRGIGFDTSRGVLLRLDGNINNLAISKFFLLIGHNDIKYRSAPEAARNIMLIFSKVKAREKYFISVPPTADQAHDRLIRELNGILMAASKEKGFRYIDLYSDFLDDGGKMKAGLFYDGVHLTVEGYRVLARGLEESLGPVANPGQP